MSTKNTSLSLQRQLGNLECTRRYRHACKTGEGRKLASMAIKELKEAKCLDCSRDYSDFGGIDVVLPDEHWALINSEGNGLLCAQCIVNRVNKLDGAIIIRATIEFESTNS